MSNLDKIAIKNLELLNNLTDNIEEYQLVINGHVISQSDEENCNAKYRIKPSGM